MIVDLSLLAPRHGLLLLTHFAATLLTLFTIVALRHPPYATIVYRAGAVVIMSVVAGSMYVLGMNSAWIGLTLAAVLIVLVGTLDEVQALKPLPQLLAQVCAAAIVVTAGWTIKYVSNISGTGVLHLDWFTLGPWIFPGSIAAIFWLVFIMNAVNWLDGVDGLSASVGSITLLTLAAISVLPQIHDVLTLELALVGVGTLLGFLIWNWPPARVYLGTSGSWFLGLYIGMVAIMSGGKVVTTLLVLSLPALDTVFVIMQRLLKNQPPWKGDTQHHLHHRLLRAGLTPTTITILITSISAILAVAALGLQTQQKMWALTIVGVGTATMVGCLAYIQKNA